LIPGFIYFLSIDYYLSAFTDFPQFVNLINLGFNAGELVSSIFIMFYSAPEPVTIILGHILIFISVCITLLLNWIITLPDVLDTTTHAHRALIALIILLCFFNGLVAGALFAAHFTVGLKLGGRYAGLNTAGAALASVVAAICRICAKAISDSIGTTMQVQMGSVNVFFSIAAVIQLLCIAGCLLMFKLPFSREVMLGLIPWRKTRLQNLFNVGKRDVDVMNELGDFSKLVTTPTTAESPNTTDNVEASPTQETSEKLSEKPSKLQVVKEWIQAIWDLKNPCFTVVMTFTITYSIFPVLVTSMKSSNSTFQTTGWNTITQLTVYAVMDCAGRFLASVEFLQFTRFYKWFPIPVMSRVIFYGLFYVMIKFSESNDAPKYLCTALFALSGVFRDCWYDSWIYSCCRASKEKSWSHHDSSTYIGLISWSSVGNTKWILCWFAAKLGSL
jgi:hypothetical protein